MLWQVVAVGAALSFTAGCWPLAIGGAALGGYYIGKDDRSAVQIADDAAVTASVKAKYIRDPTVNALDINVDTYQGIVTLYGTLPDRNAERRALALAEETRGVQRVVSRLTIVSDYTYEDRSQYGSYEQPDRGSTMTYDDRGSGSNSGYDNGSYSNGGAYNNESYGAAPQGTYVPPVQNQGYGTGYESGYGTPGPGASNPAPAEDSYAAPGALAYSTGSVRGYTPGYGAGSVAPAPVPQTDYRDGGYGGGNRYGASDGYGQERPGLLSENRGGWSGY